MELEKYTKTVFQKYAEYAEEHIEIIMSGRMGYLVGWQAGEEYAVEKILETIKANWRDWIDRDADGMIRFHVDEETIKNALK